MQNRSETVRDMIDPDGSPLASHGLHDLAERWGIARGPIDAYSRLYAASLGWAPVPSADEIHAAASVLESASQAPRSPASFVDVDRETVLGATFRFPCAIRVF